MCRDIFHALFEAVSLGEGRCLVIFVLRMVGCIANQTGWCLAAAIDTGRQGKTIPTWETEAPMEKDPSPLDIQSIDEAA